MGHVIYEPTESRIVKESVSKGTYSRKIISSYGKRNQAIYKKPEKFDSVKTIMKHIRSVRHQKKNEYDGSEQLTKYPIWCKPYIGTPSIPAYNKERDQDINRSTNNFLKGFNYFYNSGSAKRIGNPYGRNIQSANSRPRSNLLSIQNYKIEDGIQDSMDLSRKKSSVQFRLINLKKFEDLTEKVKRRRFFNEKVGQEVNSNYITLAKVEI